MEETMMESLETTHVSLPPLHWNLSSNVLCNYMKEQSYLDLILKNRAIIPRYVIEPVKYLAIDGLDQICFPMTCFCDIPFSKVSVHMSRYGEYGIGLDKEAVLKKYHVQPVHYMNPDSPLAIDFKEAFCKFYKTDKKLSGDEHTLVNYLASTLGQFTRNYTQTVKRAADNKRRYAPGEGSIPPVFLSGVSNGGPHLPHDFACKV